jgi:hypothetical protein
MERRQKKVRVGSRASFCFFKDFRLHRQKSLPLSGWEDSSLVLGFAITILGFRIVSV